MLLMFRKYGKKMLLELIPPEKPSEAKGLGFEIIIGIVLALAVVAGLVIFLRKRQTA